MSSAVCWHHSLRTSLVIVFVALLQGCCGNGNETAHRKLGGPAIDWNSPEMHEIEKEWQSLWDAEEEQSRRDKGGGKARYRTVVLSVDRLFRKRFSEEQLRQLVTSSEMVTILADDRSRFTEDVLACMVKAFVESGDRESLVELLSKRCPNRVGWPENIEFYVTHHGRKLKDPILILGEAYARSQVPETRHTLAAALRRSFAGLGIRGKDDAEFVSNAKRWYENEKGHLIVNANYTMNETNGIGVSIEDYEQHPDLYDNPPRTIEPLFKK